MSNNLEGLRSKAGVDVNTVTQSDTSALANGRTHIAHLPRDILWMFFDSWKLEEFRNIIILRKVSKACKQEVDGYLRIQESLQIAKTYDASYSEQEFIKNILYIIKALATYPQTTTAEKTRRFLEIAEKDLDFTKTSLFYPPTYKILEENSCKNIQAIIKAYIETGKTLIEENYEKYNTEEETYETDPAANQNDINQFWLWVSREKKHNLDPLSMTMASYFFPPSNLNGLSEEAINAFKTEQKSVKLFMNALYSKIEPEYVECGGIFLIKSLMDLLLAPLGYMLKQHTTGAWQVKHKDFIENRRNPSLTYEDLEDCDTSLRRIFS